MSDPKWLRELGRRRVFVFFWGFVFVALINTINEESDIFLHVFDDYVDIILAVVAVIVIGVMWRKQAMQQLKRVNNIATILAVLFILATIFAITQEYNDPADFGNEIPSLLFGIAMVINRFV